jgi:ribosome-binding protein aMBF1 (putative translation factor)
MNVKAEHSRMFGFTEGHAAARGMRALREARGWDQARLAAELDIYVSWVGSHERCATRMTEQTARKISEALGTTPEGLIEAGTGGAA